jgi:hypothetical protein
MCNIGALQENSAVESVIRCLGMFAELCILAKEDNPQPNLSSHFSIFEVDL